MTNREQQAHQTYEHILQTTEHLLTTYSYEKLSISEICEKAGVSKGGFYHHFSSKDEIIAILIGQQMQEHVYTHIEPLLGKENAKFLLQFYMQTCLEYLKNSPKDTLARCMLALSQHEELASSHLSLLSFQLLQSILAQGIEEGYFRKDLDLDFFTRFIVATYSGILFHTLSFDKDTFNDTFTDQSLELIYKTICQ